ARRRPADVRLDFLPGLPGAAGDPPAGVGDGGHRQLVDGHRLRLPGSPGAVLGGPGGAAGRLTAARKGEVEVEGYGHTLAGGPRPPAPRTAAVLAPVRAQPAGCVRKIGRASCREREGGGGGEGGRKRAGGLGER